MDQIELILEEDLRLCFANSRAAKHHQNSKKQLEHHGVQSDHCIFGTRAVLVVFWLTIETEKHDIHNWA